MRIILVFNILSLFDVKHLMCRIYYSFDTKDGFWGLQIHFEENIIVTRTESGDSDIWSRSGHISSNNKLRRWGPTRICCVLLYCTYSKVEDEDVGVVPHGLVHHHHEHHEDVAHAAHHDDQGEEDRDQVGD